MKRLIIAVAMAATLSGCAGELQNEAAQDTNQSVLGYVAKWQPMCGNYESLYTPNLNEMHYREKMGRMNAQEDAQTIEEAKAQCKENREENARIAAIQAQERAEKQSQSDNYERLCEAAHPYMVGQCLRNQAINDLTDNL